MKCSVKGCVWPRIGSSDLCRRHKRDQELPPERANFGTHIPWGELSLVTGFDAIRSELIDADAEERVLFAGMYNWRKLRLAVQFLRLGQSNRTVARQTGIYRDTVRKLSHRLRLIKPLYCPCGGSFDHRGWCGYRFQLSQSRQAFMRRWHPSVL